MIIDLLYTVYAGSLLVRLEHQMDCMLKDVGPRNLPWQAAGGSLQGQRSAYSNAVAYWAIVVAIPARTRLSHHFEVTRCV
jgi:hypothetical protein